MDSSSLEKLELPSVLSRLAEQTSFSAGRERALALLPSSDCDAVLLSQQETTEARRLLATHGEVTLGAAHDVRPQVEAAVREAALKPEDFLALRGTLASARQLSRLIGRAAGEFPRLRALAASLDDCPTLVAAIDETVDEKAEVRDSASERLSAIRAELRRAHERLLGRLQRVLAEHGAHLQEALITQREGRYVVPLRSEFKARLRGIVHDQSASGATLFVEPLATIELNNRWKEQQLLEQEEVRRVLAALTARVAERSGAIRDTVEALAEFDLRFAKARYADATRASEPILLDSDSRARLGASALRLLAARHPLLNPETVVPIDLELRPGTTAIVITGPNTGGKTVALKTAGLLALMAQCGMHIPALSGSGLAVFDSVFADIGDEQSIEQSLSTFSGHMSQVIRILREATPRSLVLLDELGAGTDPQEGSALARAILARLVARAVPTLVATHYPELKSYAHSTAGAENASVEFDPQTLRPTYRIALGIPGRSNALAIAARLGLEEDLLNQARSLLSPTDLEAGELLDDIQRAREAIRIERQQAAAARREASRAEEELAQQLAHIEDERRRVMEEARATAQEEVEATREELRLLRRRTLSLLPAEKAEELRAVEADLRALEERTAEPVGGTPELLRPFLPRVGDIVRLRAPGMQGEVLSVDGEDLEILVGGLRVRARLEDLLPTGPDGGQPTPSRLPATESPLPITPRPSPGLELDLRGMTIEEALAKLDRYLDSAYLARLPWVRIIHGKGTGRLRNAVREVLRNHALVERSDTPGDAEGGDGVTVAHLAA